MECKKREAGAKIERERERQKKEKTAGSDGSMGFETFVLFSRASIIPPRKSLNAS